MSAVRCTWNASRPASGVDLVSARRRPVDLVGGSGSTRAAPGPSMVGPLPLGPRTRSLTLLGVRGGRAWLVGLSALLLVTPSG